MNKYIDLNKKKNLFLTFVIFSSIFVLGILSIYQLNLIYAQTNSDIVKELVDSIIVQTKSSNPDAKIENVQQFLETLYTTLEQKSGSNIALEDLRTIYSHSIYNLYGIVLQSLSQLSKQVNSNNIVNIVDQVISEKTKTNEGIAQSLANVANSQLSAANQSDTDTTKLIEDASKTIANQTDDIDYKIVKQVIGQISLQAAKYSTPNVAIETIKEISNEIKQNPNGPLSEAIQQLALLYKNNYGYDNSTLSSIQNSILQGSEKSKDDKGKAKEIIYRFIILPPPSPPGTPPPSPPGTPPPSPPGTPPPTSPINCPAGKVCPTTSPTSQPPPSIMPTKKMSPMGVPLNTGTTATPDPTDPTSILLRVPGLDTPIKFPRSAIELDSAGNPVFIRSPPNPPPLVDLGTSSLPVPQIGPAGFIERIGINVIDFARQNAPSEPISTSTSTSTSNQALQQICASVVEICGDKIDNDHNGLADKDDPKCQVKPVKKDQPDKKDDNKGDDKNDKKDNDKKKSDKKEPPKFKADEEEENNGGKDDGGKDDGGKDDGGKDDGGKDDGGKDDGGGGSEEG